MDNYLTYASCANCHTERAVVFCPSDCARLCLECDGVVHGASALARLHARVPLCDECCAAPAAFRCISGVLCAHCAALFAPPEGTYARSPVGGYTGCPTPAEILRILSLEAPPSSSSQKDLDSGTPTCCPNSWEILEHFSVTIASPIGGLTQEPAFPNISEKDSTI